MEVKKKKLVVGLLFVFSSLTIGYSVGTQYFAYKVGYHKSLGIPLFNKFYNPFSIVSWMNKYKNIPYLSKLINDTSLNISVVFFLFCIIFLIILLRRDTNLNSHGSARWIRIEELEKLKVLYNNYKYGDGVILGRVKDFWGRSKTIIENDKTHISMIAPTRAGKGVGVIIPTLLNWRESTVVLDMKNENYSLTAGYRKTVLKQKVLRFAPFSADNSVSFNPLAEIRVKTIYEFKDTQIIADILTEPPEGKNRDHWSESASALLVGIILYCLYKKSESGVVACLGDVVDFLTSPSLPLIDNLAQIKNTSFYPDNSLFEKIYSKPQLEGVLEGCHPIVSRTVAEALNKAPNEFASVVSTTLKELKLFKDPIIRRNTSNVDFKVNDLMNYDTPVNLYLVVEAEAQATLAPIVRILITQIIGGLCPEMKNLDEKIHKHRLLLMLDEFPAFGKIPLVERALGYIAGYGMKVVIIAQALNQIKKLYGDKNTVLDNCMVGIYYAPSASDYDTAKLISDLLGDKTEKVKNKSGKITGGLFDGSINESKSARKLQTPEEIKNLPKTRNIILFGGDKPLKAHKIRFYEESYFKNKTKIPIPLTDRIQRR